MHAQGVGLVSTETADNSYGGGALRTHMRVALTLPLDSLIWGGAPPPLQYSCYKKKKKSLPLSNF